MMLRSIFTLLLSLQLLPAAQMYFDLTQNRPYTYVNGTDTRVIESAAGTLVDPPYDAKGHQKQNETDTNASRNIDLYRVAPPPAQ